MCGRYAQSADMRELMEQFEVTGATPPQSLPANWNIAPTNPIYIVRADQSDAMLEAAGGRRVRRGDGSLQTDGTHSPTSVPGPGEKAPTVN